MTPATCRSSGKITASEASPSRRRPGSSGGKLPGMIAGLSAALVSMLLAIAPASAHRMPGSLSTIKSNPVSGNIEIIHRLHNHDAELGLKTLLGDRTITLDTLVGRAQLALYVEDRFAIAGVEDGSRGERLALELVGAEVDGEFVLVYQEFFGELPATVAVRDDILRDVFPDQVNHVNIAVDGEVHSLTFSGDDEWRAAALR